MHIGIVAQEQDSDTFGVHRDYLSLIAEFGTPVIISPTSNLEEFHDIYSLEGLVLPGGSDVAASRYGAWTHFKAYRPNPYLEHFDTEILPYFIRAGMPIFGICRGLQTLNVLFGGSLYQHLWRHPYSKEKTDLVHRIYPTNGGKEIQQVNSFHHQSIKNLGKSLEVLAVAEDGTIEAIRHTNYPIFAVQWHPERIHDEFSLNLMRKLFA